MIYSCFLGDETIMDDVVISDLLNVLPVIQERILDCVDMNGHFTNHPDLSSSMLDIVDSYVFDRPYPVVNGLILDWHDALSFCHPYTKHHSIMAARLANSILKVVDRGCFEYLSNLRLQASSKSHLINLIDFDINT
jgi:hypothetical protein